MRTCLYSSRNRQVPTVPYQPFLPAIQRSDDGSSLIFRPQETQPFLPAIQRSADGSSNSRQTTLPTTLKDQPGRCVRSVTGSAGGELILGWWKSALFFKSSLFERSEFGLLENAFSRFPAA